MKDMVLFNLMNDLQFHFCLVDQHSGTPCLERKIYVQDAIIVS